MAFASGVTTTTSVVDDAVHVGEKDGLFHALASRDSVWEFEVGHPVAGVRAADDVLYAPAQDGHLFALGSP